MSEQEWAQFFDLLNKIVNMPGTYQEKVAKLDAAAEANDSIGEFEELLYWYS